MRMFPTWRVDCFRSRMRKQFRTAFDLSRETLAGWWNDKATLHAAGLAFYTAFSIAPMLVIAAAVASLVFGESVVQAELERQMVGFVGSSTAQAIEEIMRESLADRENVFASIVGLVTLVFGATAVFAQLQDSLNMIWRAKPRKGNGIWLLIRQRFLSFAMVLSIGFILLVSLALNIALSAFGAWVSGATDVLVGVWQVLDLLLSTLVIATLFAMIFKFLPDVNVRWNDVWFGALVTSLLFAGGKSLIGLYLTRVAPISVFGAAGSLAILLLWVYYSSMILFLGAEFTRVLSYARHGALEGQDLGETAFANTRVV